MNALHALHLLRNALILAVVGDGLALITGCASSKTALKETMAPPALQREIHEAIHDGDLGKLKRLLHVNPDLVYSKDSYGSTPLHSAAVHGHKGMVELLLANNAEYTIHDMAAVGDLAKVKALLKANPDLVFSKDIWGYTPLHFAAEGGHKAVVKLLLAKGADVNASNIYAAPLHAAVRGGNKDIVELLLVRKVDVNVRGIHSGRTPLHDAAYAGHKDIVELLLARKADVNAKDNLDRTPLGDAIIGEHKDVVELLRKHGGHE